MVGLVHKERTWVRDKYLLTVCCEVFGVWVQCKGTERVYLWGVELFEDIVYCGKFSVVKLYAFFFIGSIVIFVENFPLWVHLEGRFLVNGYFYLGYIFLFP